MKIRYIVLAIETDQTLTISQSLSNPYPTLNTTANFVMQNLEPCSQKSCILAKNVTLLLSLIIKSAKSQIERLSDPLHTNG